MHVHSMLIATLVIQSSAGQVNDDLMELLVCISAAKLASARKVRNPVFFIFQTNQD